MNKIRNLFNSLPRRYRHYPYIVLIISVLIFLIYLHHSWQSQAVVTKNDPNNVFDLFDDDDAYLICPPEVQFKISNRRHLAIIVGPKLVSFVWKNFHALLCTGVDVYVMLDEVFQINSSSRGDNVEARTHRSIRSYTHRFLYVPNEELIKYGVSHMIKYPTTKYGPWDRTIVWLYHRRYLKNVWVMDYKVQWFHVQNMTYFFDLYDSDSSDILCADIVPTDAKGWRQWPKKASDIFPKSYWIGTFSPFVRWSRRLLLHHYQYMQLMHKDRIKYEIHPDFRFQEFLLGTIANIEQLSVALYNQKYEFTQISLARLNDAKILSLLQRGKHILFPIDYDSVLTKNRIEEIAEMVRKI